MKAKGIWMKSSGEIEDIKFSGNKITLEEMQKCVGGYVEPIYFEDKIMLVNEEGLIQRLPMNIAATSFLKSQGIPHSIVGDVLIISQEFVD
jgi:hypothetical protein